MSLLAQKSVEIGGKLYQIGTLPYAKSRPAFVRVAKLLTIPDEVVGDTGLFMMASVAGGLDDEDLKFFVETFGEVCTVQLGPDKVVKLNSEMNLNAAFAGNIEDMFAWLDACVEFNFSGAKAKLIAAAERRAQAAAKAEPNT